MENEKLKNKRIIFVLGGPGSGKGTHSLLLCDFAENFRHFSAGDLLRKAKVEDSPEDRMIANHIKNGTIVPGHVTISLLRKAILEVPENVVILVDGFPREMDQAKEFEENIVPCEFVLFMDCSLECMKKRLLFRGKTSLREDDKEEVIRKRFVTYKNQTKPVLEYFKYQNRLKTVCSDGSKEETFELVKKVFNL